jgi:hypothetical protein
MDVLVSRLLRGCREDTKEELYLLDVPLPELPATEEEVYYARGGGGGGGLAGIGHLLQGAGAAGGSGGEGGAGGMSSAQYVEALSAVLVNRRSSSRDEKVRRLLYVLQRDLLGDPLVRTVLDNKSVRDNYRRDGTAFPAYNSLHIGAVGASTVEKRWLTVILVLLVCVMVLFILYYALIYPAQLQKAWLYCLLGWIGFDLLFVSTAEVLVLHVYMPFTIRADMRVVYDLVDSMLRKYFLHENGGGGVAARSGGATTSSVVGATYSTFDEDEEGLAGRPLNARMMQSMQNQLAEGDSQVPNIAEFFFVSTRLAQYFGELRQEAAFVLSYATMLPPDAPFRDVYSMWRTPLLHATAAGEIPEIAAQPSDQQQHQHHSGAGSGISAAAAANTATAFSAIRDRGTDTGAGGGGSGSRSGPYAQSQSQSQSQPQDAAEAHGPRLKQRGYHTIFSFSLLYSWFGSIVTGCLCSPVLWQEFYLQMFLNLLFGIIAIISALMYQVNPFFAAAPSVVFLALVAGYFAVAACVRAIRKSPTCACIASYLTAPFLCVMRCLRTRSPDHAPATAYAGIGTGAGASTGPDASLGIGGAGAAAADSEMSASPRNIQVTLVKPGASAGGGRGLFLRAILGTGGTSKNNSSGGGGGGGGHSSVVVGLPPSSPGDAADASAAGADRYSGADALLADMPAGMWDTESRATLPPDHQQQQGQRHGQESKSLGLEDSPSAVIMGQRKTAGLRAASKRSAGRGVYDEAYDSEDDDDDDFDFDDISDDSVDSDDSDTAGVGVAPAPTSAPAPAPAPTPKLAPVSSVVVSNINLPSNRAQMPQVQDDAGPPVLPASPTGKVVPFSGFADSADPGPDPDPDHSVDGLVAAAGEAKREAEEGSVGAVSVRVVNTDTDAGLDALFSSPTL